MSRLSQMSTPKKFAFKSQLDLIESLSFFSACYSVGGLGVASILLGTPLSIWAKPGAQCAKKKPAWSCDGFGMTNATPCVPSS